MSRAVAIITARGGSKRIPRKNIKDFLGKPIIAYSIASSRDAGCFSLVMVSTDDREIADVAGGLGAEVPFLRSSAASGDHATTADVISEVVAELEKRGLHFDYGCCIYPTAPFVTAAKLNRGYALLKETDADSLVPVVRFGYPIQRALKIENGRLSMMWPEHLLTRSQDLMATYHDAGQFYWLNLERFAVTRSLLSGNTVPLEIPDSEVQDIDNEEDWKIAEQKFRFLFEG
jgi:N-acylneuraminate cytidylyltransferase